MAVKPEREKREWDKRSDLTFLLRWSSGGQWSRCRTFPPANLVFFLPIKLGFEPSWVISGVREDIQPQLFPCTRNIWLYTLARIEGAHDIKRPRLLSFVISVLIRPDLRCDVLMLIVSSVIVGLLWFVDVNTSPSALTLMYWTTHRPAVSRHW